MEKIRKKWNLKTCGFSISIFSVFFSIFRNFGSILGGPGPSKNSKKSEKIVFVSRSVLKGGSGRVLGGFWEDLGRVLGGFWERFGKVLDGFWEDFVLESRIVFGETCVKRFRLKTLL